MVPFLGAKLVYLGNFFKQKNPKTVVLHEDECQKVAISMNDVSEGLPTGDRDWVISNMGKHYGMHRNKSIEHIIRPSDADRKSTHTESKPSTVS